MKIPSLKRILKEDLKDAPNWVDGIIGPVNSFMEYIYQSLNKNINDADNIACTIKEFTYITPSTYPVMDDIEFLSGLKVKATSVILQQILVKSDYMPPVSAVYVPWFEKNGSIVIRPIVGLAASTSYIVRIKIS